MGLIPKYQIDMTLTETEKLTAEIASRLLSSTIDVGKGTFYYRNSIVDSVKLAKMIIEESKETKTVSKQPTDFQPIRRLSKSKAQPSPVPRKVR
jgi:hypothetical protein